ncbi:MAG: flagellar hook-associated protein FlgK [Acidimicrobiales bacterium]
MLRGLSIAASGLNAAQRGLDVTAHNIANANTVGYTRQQVVQVANKPSIGGVPLQGPGTFGNGATVQEVRQLRDGLVDDIRRTSLSDKGAAQHLATAMRDLEAIVGPLDSGLSADFDNFWNSWNEVNLHPEQVAPRGAVIDAAQKLAADLRNARAQIDGISTRCTQQLGADAQEVNAAAREVASLNQTILEVTSGGGQPNDLFDQRAIAIDRLAELTGATIRRNGPTVDVVVGGAILVSGGTASTMAVSGNPPTVTVDGAVAKVGGAMGAAQQVAGSGLDDLRTRLDLLAVGLRDALNSAHANGFDLDGNPGGPIFTGTGASSFAVDAALTARRLAASATGAAADGNNALVISGLRDGTIIGSVNAPASLTLRTRDALADLTAVVGVSAAAADRTEQMVGSALAAADARRDEVSGVSIDEEMTQLMRYQRAYEAAARVVTAMDDVLDTLVNRLGLVGR